MSDDNTKEECVRCGDPVDVRDSKFGTIEADTPGHLYNDYLCGKCAAKLEEFLNELE